MTLSRFPRYGGVAIREVLTEYSQEPSEEWAMNRKESAMVWMASEANAGSLGRAGRPSAGHQTSTSPQSPCGP